MHVLILVFCFLELDSYILFLETYALKFDSLKLDSYILFLIYCSLQVGP
jgi:hypothetical protein